MTSHVQIPADQAAVGRQTLRFPSGKELCDAWFYRPEGAVPPQGLPVVVMAHGLGGIKRAGLAAFAERFCAAGYACLVFDYRYFGDSTGYPRELLDVPSQLADWRAAVAYARSLPGVDPVRVVVWGTSFGGGHAIVTAAEDPRIAAAIAQCPFTDGVASSLAVDFRTSLKLSTLMLRDLLAQWRGLAPVRVPTVGRPGEVALMTSPDAQEGYYAIQRHAGAEDVPEDVPARIALQLLRHSPGRRVKDVRCPILFCVCEDDTVAPAGPTLRYAKRALRGEVRRYPTGHFDIYQGTEYFERNIGDQIAFLKARVPV